MSLTTPKCLLISHHRRCSAAFAIFLSFLFWIQLFSSTAMMIKKEIKHPDFDFSIDESERCRFSPDPHRVKDALFFVVECSSDVSKIKLTFNGTKTVYDIDGNTLPAIVSYPSLGQTSTQFVMSCIDLSKRETCNSIQIDVIRSNGETPLLSHRGLIFSNYASSPTFDQNKLTYDIELYARESTTIGVRSSTEYFVDFEQGFDERGFIESSAFKQFTPQGIEGETESFQIFVTNSDRSIITTYTINAKIVRSVNPRLESIDVSPGRLDPAFMSHKYSYFYRVPEGTRKVTLQIKAINDRDARCFVQPVGLGKDQVPITPLSSSVSDTLVKTFNITKFWDSSDDYLTTESTRQRLHTLPDPIPLGGSGKVTMRIPSPVRSTNIVVDCVAADDTFKVRYIFNVVEQVGGSTLLQNLEVPGIPFNRPFDPLSSGPYHCTVNQSDENIAKWVSLRVVPNSPRAICKVEGKEVDSKTHLSKYFRVLPGEKRQFRVSVRTPENAVEEEYFVIVDRPAPWYRNERIASRIADWVGLTSSAVAATRGVNFINNAKFLHFISLTNRLNRNPESYDSYSAHLNQWNLQWDLSSRVYMVDQFNNQTFYALTDNINFLREFDQSFISPAASHLLLSRENANSWGTVVKKAASRLRMYEAPVQAIRSDVAANAEWTAVHPDRSLFENSVLNVLLNMMKEKIKKDQQFGSMEALHTVNPHRLLLENDVDQHDILMQLDAEYKKQQKLVNCCSSIFITTLSLLVIVSVYILIWMFYLRDSRLGWLYLRQDFPAVLKPTRFWTFLFDYALISYLQSCCGIIFTTGYRDSPIRMFGLTLSINKLAWFAGIAVFFIPIAFLVVGCGVLFRIHQGIVFSKLFQRYHDSLSEELKASQRFFSCFPILSNIFTIEITSVAPVTRYPTQTPGVSDGPIHFTAESGSSAPFLVGDPDKLVHQLRDSMDVEDGHRGVDFHSLLGSEQQQPLYHEKEDLMKVALTQDAFETRLDTIDPVLYNRFPEALLGFSKYKFKNAYDHLISVQVQIQLRHLTSLMNLQSYALWVPRENLRQDEVDNWNLLFGKSQKGNFFYWTLDRCMTAAIIVFLTTWTDRQGITHTLVFAFICLLLAILYLPSAFSSAMSKWFRVMDVTIMQKKNDEHLKSLDDHRFKVWPFRRFGVKDRFHEIRQRKRDFEMWGCYKILRQSVKEPFNKFRGLEFWRTRCWLTIRECVTGPVLSELLKFFTLFTLFMGKYSSNLYSNSVATVFGMMFTIVALVCLNTEGIGDWWKHLCLMVVEIMILVRRLLIRIVDVFSEPRLIGRKFTHFVSSCQRVFQGEKGVAFGYPGYYGEKVRDFKVDSVVIINNEVGVHLPGQIVHSAKTKNEMKYLDCMEKGRVGIHKTLHINGSIGTHRFTLDRSMPIQMPFKQFFHLGKGTGDGNVIHRLAATIQIVNYNESRGASGYQHSADDDSFLSLYIDPQLMPEYGKVGMKRQGHGYVVRWMPEKQCIYIRGPAIKSDVDYSIITVESKQEVEDDQLSTESSLRSAELIGDREGEGSAEAMCKSSGLLVVPVNVGEIPDMNFPIVITRQDGESFEVDSSTIKVDFHQYNVGRSQRRKIIIRSRKLIASPTLYHVKWIIKTKGKDIDISARSPADGVLFVPWTDALAPNLDDYIVLRDKSSESTDEATSIHIDPKETDAYQFILPPAKYNGMARIVASIKSGITQFGTSIIGRSVSKDIIDEPIPCTIVQCTNPLERQYRVEPNFNEAMKTTSAKIEHLMALKRDVELPERLGYMWNEFMSASEFIRFWESLGLNIVIRGAWLNPITNMNHIYVKNNQHCVQNGQMKFRAEIARRIEARIGILTNLYERYRNWNRAYTDSTLYSYQLSREAAEWGIESTTLLGPQVQQLQKIKLQYEAVISGFQYPMTVNDRLICRREKFDAQLRVWREQLAAWLLQCEGASALMEQGGKSCAQATTDDVMRAIEHSIRKTEHAQSGIYRTILHYVVSSVAIRGRETNWKPDPLCCHYCMVRLFKGDKEDVDSVDWSKECWTPCYLKLAGDKINLLFPHELDAKANVPEYYDDDITKRWTWNQIQGYYIPLECFERMFLSIDPSIANDPNASDDVKRMHAKLVMRKNTEFFVDDRYVKSLFTGEFFDELLLNEGNVLKIRLGHTISEKDQAMYNRDGSFLHGNRCTVLPLTFRFHCSYFDKWQSAIRLAQMNAPRKNISDFDGHVDGDGYSADESLSDPAYALQSSSSYSSSSSSSSSVQSPSISSEKTTTIVEEPPVIDVSEYKGEFRDYRFSGHGGRLYDSDGRLIYDGDWVEGQRWGKGRSLFQDHQRREWEFEGEFIADEMSRGRLTLVDENEINRLRNSKNPADRFSITAYNGQFRLPATLRGSVKGQTKMRDFSRTASNCAMRSKPNISPNFLKALFDSGNAIDEDERKDIMIDIRRAISACADVDTANATTAWVQDNYGLRQATKFDRDDSFVSEDSDITIDAVNAFEEYLPHRSRWVRLLDPNSGYQSLFDRFADGEVVFADGSRYKGEIQDGLPNGRGVLSCPKCDLVYNGYWDKGRPSGYGTLSVGEQGDPERMEYYGNFKEGKRDGRGIQLGKNGKVVIKGDFKDDILDGTQCSIDLADDVLPQFAGAYKRYIGGVKNGMLDGKGKLEWGDGPSYKGDFKDGKRHGHGSVKDRSNKTVITGKWEKDFPEGRVMAMILPDGKVYSGDIRQGQRQGMGELYHHGVALYEGLWMNDLPNGRGALYTEDGDYEGEFKSGKRHGKGRFEFKSNPLPNGKLRVYEGDWKNDKPDGTGRYVNELGVENTYKFKAGELIPSSTKVYKSGVCGKSPTMGVEFRLEPSGITAHDPKHWGLKRKFDAEKIRVLHSIGVGEWEKHQNKPFVYMEASSSLLPLVDVDELSRAPVKQKSLQSLLTSSDTRPAEILEIRILEGTNLPIPESKKKMNPYCRVIVGRKMKKTKPIDGGGSNPKWNAKLNFEKSGGEWVNFEVWDKDPLSRDDLIGHAEYHLKPFLESGEKDRDQIIPLVRGVQGKGQAAGSIRVSFSLAHKFLNSSTESQTLASMMSGPIEIGKAFVEIHAHSVRGLYNTETFGKMDPYLKYELGPHRTQTDFKINGGTSCDLNFVTTIPYNNEPTLRFEVWDHDRLSKDDLVGYGSLNLDQFKTGEVEIFRDGKKVEKGGRRLEPISAGFVKFTVSIIHGSPPAKGS